ncbi:MAG: hypothetical protein U9R07_08115 [Pseudomonadota bacterium]|nr:hypothetical protein [Pseudomonadota bacterium]
MVVMDASGLQAKIDDVHAAIARGGAVALYSEHSNGLREIRHPLQEEQGLDRNRNVDSGKYFRHSELWQPRLGRTKLASLADTLSRHVTNPPSQIILIRGFVTSRTKLDRP